MVQSMRVGKETVSMQGEQETTNRDPSQHKRIKAQCQSGREYSLSPTALGKKAKCACGRIFVVRTEPSEDIMPKLGSSGGGTQEGVERKDSTVWPPSSQNRKAPPTEGAQGGAPVIGNAMITFECSSCGVRLRVSDDKSGRKSKCPSCSAPVLVPAMNVEGPARETESATQTQHSQPARPSVRTARVPSNTAASPQVGGSDQVLRQSAAGQGGYLKKLLICLGLWVLGLVLLVNEGNGLVGVAMAGGVMALATPCFKVGYDCIRGWV